jgi:invasion protein IalB
MVAETVVMKFIGASLAGALAFGVVSFASADPAPNAPLVPTETKSFGDWTVRCYPVSSPSPCDMYELLANKQTNQRVMSLSIAYMPAGDKHVIQIAVPLGVLIPSGMVIESDTYTSPMLRYRRCDRAGCYVEMIFDNDAVTSLGAATGAAKIKIVADGGKVFEIPFSLTGYTDAHGAMVDLARKKTAKPAATAPAPAKP